MSIQSYYTDISRYNSLKSSLNLIANGLNNACGKLSPVPNTIYNSYNIDEGETPIIKRVNSLGSDMDYTARLIFNTIIPAIDREIYRRRVEISRLEAEMYR